MLEKNKTYRPWFLIIAILLLGTNLLFADKLIDWAFLMLTVTFYYLLRPYSFSSMLLTLIAMLSGFLLPLTLIFSKPNVGSNLSIFLFFLLVIRLVDSILALYTKKAPLRDNSEHDAF